MPDLRTLLATGDVRALANALVGLEPEARRQAARPLVKQAKAILSASLDTTVEEWLSDLRPDYPGGREQFVDAWGGRTSEGHWDGATTVLLAAKAAPQAAKVWPIPGNAVYAEWIYSALFGDELSVVAEQWSADFATNPKHWDRNAGRDVMYGWVETGLIAAPAHDGAVLMLLGGWAASPGPELLEWLKAHPRVTETLFTKVFTTPGIKGASLAQADGGGGDPMRLVVIPGLVEAGLWSREFVARQTQTALSMELPPYQRGWFAKLGADLGI